MKDQTKTAVILGVILFALAYISFNTICENDFIEYDDTLYITKNPSVLSGLTRDSIKWAFITTETGNWIPLTWLSHMLDVQLFGQNPGKHHQVNLLFHCLNTLLVFALFYKTTGRLGASFLAALLFSVHPLRVESVAWASERKDTLSASWGLLCLLTYRSYAQNKTKYAYSLTCIFLILGLMSKAMLVTWPFLFLVLDYWPLKRFGVGNHKNTICTRYSKKSFRSIIIEKVPFGVIAAAFCVIAYWAQKTESAVMPTDSYPVFYRLENIVISYSVYLKLLFYPKSLGIFYPIDPTQITHARFLGSFLILLCITSVVLYFRQQKGYLLMGWLWFLGTLVPVMGLVQVGMQSMADRYTYIPSIGISFAIAFALADLTLHRPRLKWLVIAGVIPIICTLIFLTWIQTIYWKDSLSLYSHTLAITKNNYTMHYNYGCALANNGYLDEAMIQFQKAHELKSNSADPLEKIAQVHMDNHNYPQAIEYLQQALEKENADREKSLLNMGVCYQHLKQFNSAIQCYNLVLSKDSQSISLMNNLVNFYMSPENPLYSPPMALKYAQALCLLTDFKHKESLIRLIGILEENPPLENTLSREFLDQLKNNTSRLKLSAPL